MKKDLTLVILAAGMGSRFGGLKQIAPVGPSGEFIIDYSIYDAIKAGFTKVVFIIKKENFDIFKETIGSRVEDKIRVEYVFQEMDDLPAGVIRPDERIKPWGTVHALLAAKDVVNEPFAMINADDYYGYDAYRVASDYLNNNSDDKYAMVGYRTGNTLSPNGAVKRGICKSTDDGYLTEIIESNIKEVNGNAEVVPLDTKIEPFIDSLNSLVSMNFFCFYPTVFALLEKKFDVYLKNNDLLTCEYVTPEFVRHLVQDGFKVRALSTTAKWFGMTYPEDKQLLIEELNKLIAEGNYKERLWSDYE